MRSGMVTVAGRPNVGKSSLINAVVGRKVSIVSHKPQTTRHRIQGVLHSPDSQIVFVDTPGLHLNIGKVLNRYMNEVAAASLDDVDLVLFVIEAGRWTEEDEAVLERLKLRNTPVGLVVNKVDRLKDKKQLLPELQAHAARHAYAFIVPVSARRKDNLDALVHEILPRLPEGPPLYPPDQVVGYDLAFAASEIVREKLIQRLHQEVPYALTVQIESLEQKGALTRIGAVIWVEREGQKAIVIGENGQGLKEIGTAARKELEYTLGHKVFLRLWVKVLSDWTDDATKLQRLGYPTS